MNILKIKRALAELVWTGALLFAAASVFLRPGAAAGGVLRGLSVCYETVIPALFPFLVLSRLLLESRAASALGLLLRPYTRLLGLHSPKAPAAMLCGVLGGFAGGAKAVDVLYRTGELTAAEAALLLVCTIGSGPGFVVSSVGALMLGSAGAGWLLLGAQLGASLVCGLAAALFVRLRKRGSIAGRFRAAVACAAQTGKGMPAGRCSVPQKTQRRRPSQTGFFPAVRDSVNAIVMLRLCNAVLFFCRHCCPHRRRCVRPLLGHAASGGHQRVPRRLRDCIRLAHTAVLRRTQCNGRFRLSAGACAACPPYTAAAAAAVPSAAFAALAAAVRAFGKAVSHGVVRGRSVGRQPSSGCAHAAGCNADIIRHGRAGLRRLTRAPVFTPPLKRGIINAGRTNAPLPQRGQAPGKEFTPMFTKPLFGRDIPPACEYCSHVVRAADGSLRCTRRGAVQPFDHCRAFSYDPLRRVPRRTPQLPTFSPDDFKL
ncbi:nucleoside recognition domain-containing protein [Ruthenibacterium lactatiformans]|uniref:nucleoside recognition domain-containing protein n=1 Tax=Ruthenibacterium lactatiformans TaxID=1550024 RepID=UPI00399F5062